MKSKRLQVETGIRMPRGGSPRYPFEDMEIGDSFKVTEAPKCFKVSVHSCARRKGFKISVRNFGDHWRVWRVA